MLPNRNKMKYNIVILMLMSILSIIFGCSKCKSDYKYEIYKFHIIKQTDDEEVKEIKKISPISNIW